MGDEQVLTSADLEIRDKIYLRSLPIRAMLVLAIGNVIKLTEFGKGQTDVTYELTPEEFDRAGYREATPDILAYIEAVECYKGNDPCNEQLIALHDGDEFFCFTCYGTVMYMLGLMDGSTYNCNHVIEEKQLGQEKTYSLEQLRRAWGAGKAAALREQQQEASRSA